MEMEQASGLLVDSLGLGCKVYCRPLMNKFPHLNRDYKRDPNI